MVGGVARWPTRDHAVIEIDFTKVIAGFGRVQRKFVASYGFMALAGDLMEHWERLVEVDNRNGVLSGIDKDDNPAPAVTYRPTGPKGVKLTVGQRLGQHVNKRRGEYAGIGNLVFRQYGLLENNNLTSSDYRKLDGPRLAPRLQFSRAITNFMTTSFPDPEVKDQWVIRGEWQNVVTPKGKHFLHYHFDGDGQQRYDLRGVRRDGVAKCIASLRAWVKLTIREVWRGAA